MKILLTNDDGFDSPGLLELVRVVPRDSELFVVAPRSEQSGVSQAITFLHPLFPRPIRVDAHGENVEGYSVDGTPTDCVKLAIFDLCPWKPDLILSGINGGLNVGSNTAYSGTVAGALCGAMFGIPSIAVSTEYGASIDFARSAEMLWPIIQRLSDLELRTHTMFNVNVPEAALTDPDPQTVVVPVETNPLGYEFERGEDPKGRKYFWANNQPAPEPSPFETDSSALRSGKITISTITGNMNCPESLSALKAVFA